MKPLTPEDMSEIRARIARFYPQSNLSDDMLRLLDSVAISFIDLDSGRHPVQLSLSARANQAFKNREKSQDFSCSDGHHRVAFNDEDEVDSSSYQNRFEPG